MEVKRSSSAVSNQTMKTVLDLYVIIGVTAELRS